MRVSILAILGKVQEAGYGMPYGTFHPNRVAVEADKGLKVGIHRYPGPQDAR